MTITYQVYRLLDDGEEQSLGYFVNDRDAMIKAFEYYSEVRYPHAYVDYREVSSKITSTFGMTVSTIVMPIVCQSR